MTTSAAFALLDSADVLAHLPNGTTVHQDGRVVRIKWDRLSAALRLCPPEESGIRIDDRSIVAQALHLAGY